MQERDIELGDLLPRMVVPPPGPKSHEMARQLSEVEMPNGSPIKWGITPIFWSQAKGSNVVDPDGNIYIDLTGGSSVATAGHCNDDIVAAIQRQAEILLHTQGITNPSPCRIELCRKLREITPGDLSMSHLASGGAEAVEVAYKTARLYTKKHGVIAFQQGFHGKTGTPLTLTSRSYYRDGFLPLTPGVVHLPYAYCYRCPFERRYPECDCFCARFVEYNLDMHESGLPEIAAIVMEAALGHGGWVFPPPEFLQRIRRMSAERGILLIMDEIITGFGRTGKMFACEHSEVVPDIMVLGKAMASGLPISAVVTTEEIGSCWQPAQHSSTFLGHPLGVAACMASLNYIITHGLVQRSAELGAYAKSVLAEMQQRHPLIGDVRGLGLMFGVEIVKDRTTKVPGVDEAMEVVTRLYRKGIMASNLGGTHKNVLKLSPPLVITREQLDYALKAIDDALGEVEYEKGYRSHLA